MPALVDGDVKLWESNAIACYLASKTDNDLWPKSNLRYDIMRWQSWGLVHFQPVAAAITFERVVKPLIGGEPDQAVCEKAEEDFKRFAAVLDGHLEGKRYLVADKLTIADICVAAPLTYAIPAKHPIDGFGHLKAWLSGLDEHEGWRASGPPPM